MKNKILCEAKSVFGGKKIILTLFLAMFLSFPAMPSTAERNIITDWYIQNFESEIVVNKDSTLTITEKITADCGNLSGKHGIFRVLPTQINTTDRGVIKTPLKLISITDFNGNNYNYSTLNDSSNHTLTWKIGDANKTVSGVNYYQIKYRVENAILTENANFDELYWNLNGNFWDIETDNFSAKIIFPEEINQQNSRIYYYTGTLGSKESSLAIYQWESPNILIFSSTKTLAIRQGITASISFPEGFITPYKEPLTQKYAWTIIFIFPIIIFIICFWLWKKYGDDPKWDKTVIPEFDIPEKLTPLELGVLKTNGAVSPEFITATIINFAVNEIITIEEIRPEGVFNKLLLGKKIKFYLKNNSAELEEPEKMILQLLFGENLTDKETTDEIVKARMRNKTTFSKDLKKAVISNLYNNDLIIKTGIAAKK